MDQETVVYSKQGPIAHVLLNRPQVVNAYDTRMRDELFQALQGKIAELHNIGDSLSPRGIEQAVFEGHKIGREL